MQQLFEEIEKSIKEQDERLKNLENFLIEIFKSKEEKEKEENKNEEEYIKTFEECTIGEKFIIYLLENKKIPVSEDMIKDAETFITNNPALDFLAVSNPKILDDIGILLNSLYAVDITKLRKMK